MALGLKSTVLSRQEIDTMKGQIATILSKKGVHAPHPQVEKYLREAGCEVKDSHVKFPVAVQEKYLAMAPREFTLAAIDPRYDIEIPHPQNSFYTRVNTGGMNYIDAQGGYGLIGLKEVSEIVRTAQAMEHIDFWSIPSTSPRGFPAETLDVHTLNTIFQNTTKHGWMQPYEAYNAKYLIEMAAVLAGGKDALRKRPIVSLICCSVPMLSYKFMDLQILLDGALHGVPLQTCSLPVAGANAPITPSGLAIIAASEVVAMILMAQMINPGHPCVATPLLFEMDMKTTYTLQSTVETTLGRMMAMQLFREGYNLPAHTYGTGTDSAILDGQNFAERMSVTQMVALSGATILGGAGQMETAKTVSPLLMIIDDEIFGMTKKLVEGCEVNDDTVGLDTILEMPHEDSFILADHTMEYYRDGFRPNIFNRTAMPDRSAEKETDVLYKARCRFESIMKEQPTTVVDDKMQAELDQIVARADKDIAKI